MVLGAVVTVLPAALVNDPNVGLVLGGDSAITGPLAVATEEKLPNMGA